MTKKEYVAIAEVIRDVRKDYGNSGSTDAGAREALDTLTSNLADVFKADNTAFDRDRFVRACIRQA